MKKAVWQDIKEIALMICVFVFIHTQICAQAVIPSASMVPTLNEGDRLLINKLAPKYKSPIRGDIVVFLKEEKFPFNEYWIKRVIALPGETIDIRNNTVYIDDVALIEDYTQGVTEPFEWGIELPYTVPEAHYFLLGDNRQGSKDSRAFGAISMDDITAIGGFKMYPFTDIGILN